MTWRIVVKREDQTQTECNMDECNVSATSAITKKFTGRITNIDGAYTDKIDIGDSVELYFSSGIHDERGQPDFVGIITSRSMEDSTMLLEGQDWTSFTIGPKVTERFYGKDVGWIFKFLIKKYAPLLKTDKLIEIGYIDTLVMNFLNQELREVLDILARKGGARWRVDNDKQVILYKGAASLEFVDTFSTYPEGSDASPVWNPMFAVWKVQDGKYWGLTRQGFFQGEVESSKIDLIKAMGWGTDNTPGGGNLRDEILRKLAIKGTSDGKACFKATIEMSELNDENIGEVGLFTEEVGGECVLRITFTKFVKSSEMQLNFFIEVSPEEEE